MFHICFSNLNPHIVYRSILTLKTLHKVVLSINYLSFLLDIHTLFVIHKVDGVVVAHPCVYTPMFVVLLCGNEFRAGGKLVGLGYAEMGARISSHNENATSQ